MAISIRSLKAQRSAAVGGYQTCMTNRHPEDPIFHIIGQLQDLHGFELNDEHSMALDL